MPGCQQPRAAPIPAHYDYRAPAGLHVLDLTGPSPAVTRVTPSAPLSIPSSLVFLPLQPPAGAAGARAASNDRPGPAGRVPSEELAGPGGTGPLLEAALEGLLLLGSPCGSSQVVGVPRRRAGTPPLPSPSAGGGLGGVGGGGAAAPAAAAAAAVPLWPVLQSALLPSLAPAMCAAVVEGGSDGPGALSEASVVVGCGCAPRGRVARVRSGVGLRPFVLDGPELPVCACAALGGFWRRQGWMLFDSLSRGPSRGPRLSRACRTPAPRVKPSHVIADPAPARTPPPQGGVTLFPVAADPSAPGAHTHLLISLEGAARGTMALAVSPGGGGGLAQVELPGLDPSGPCLAAAGCLGGWVAVAAEAGLRVLGRAPAWGLAHQWAAPGDE
jgi:hypothetical protein